MILTITNNTIADITLLGLPGGGVVRAGATITPTIAAPTREQTDALKRLEALGSITWSVATDDGDFPIPGETIEYDGADNDVPGTDVTFNGAGTNYLAVPTNPQTALVALDAQVKTTADGVGTNVTNIGTNSAALGAKDDGHVAFADALISVIPTTTNHVDIGGTDVYEFVTSGDTTAVVTNIAVTLTGALATNLQALADAINKVATDPNPDVLAFGGGSQAPGVGTENVLATVTAGGITLEHADAPGGTAVASAAALALAMTMTSGSNVWRPGHTNMNVLGGRVASPPGVFTTQVPITTALIDTAGVLTLAFPRTITGFTAQAVISATGILRSLCAGTDVFVITGPELAVTMNGGGSANNLHDGDVLHVIAW